jgi:hypothetical protein
MCEGKHFDRRGMNIVLVVWRCHCENALEHDRDLKEGDDGLKKVKPSVCLAQAGHSPPQASDRNGYEKNGQRATVWNVTFSNVPGGPQDHEEEQAIESYAQFKDDACKNHQVSSHDMTTVNC